MLHRVVCDLGAVGAAPDLTTLVEVDVVRVGRGGDVADVIVPDDWSDARRLLRSQPRTALRVAAELSLAAGALVSSSPPSAVAAAVRFVCARIPGTPEPVVVGRLPAGSWLADVSGAPDSFGAAGFVVALVELLLDRQIDVAVLDPGATPDPRWSIEVPGARRIGASEVGAGADLVLAAGPVGRAVFELLTPAEQQLGILVGVPLPVVVTAGPVSAAAVRLADRLAVIGWPERLRELALAEVARRRRGVPSDPS